VSKPRPETHNSRPGGPHNPLEEINDLLDRLPLQSCVELTRRLLTSISSLPTGTAHPWNVLKTVILFVTECGSTP